jgi:hypothetical protein
MASDAILAAVPPYPEGMISLDPATIYRERFTSAADVVETVRRWGIIVFPAFVPPDVLARLNAELDLMIEVRGQLGAPVDAYGNLVNLRLDRETYRQVFPATTGFFGQNLMQDVAGAYFDEAFQLNRQIFANVIGETKTRQAKPPFALHFDKRPSLKFFVYLSATDARNGAMRVTPGSIMHNRPIREQASVLTEDLEQIENVVPEPLVPSIPVTGPAGTMFVFDPDVNHGAGTVQPGLTRRTMRGHTQTNRILRRIGYSV